jgi:crossover junction endodeoxyribonuclease RusA
VSLELAAQPDLTFTVDGVPVPQGSMRAFLVKGRPVVTHGGRADLGTWRQAIAARARAAGAVPVAGPVSIGLTFTLPRPASRPKRDRHPDRKPDLDKLIRAALDALTGIAFVDDAQVVRCHAWKRYATMDPPGLIVTLTPSA